MPRGLSVLLTGDKFLARVSTSTGSPPFDVLRQGSDVNGTH